MLTARGKYGLKAMIHLAGLEAADIAQVADIAQACSIPKKFLDQILSELRNGGLAFSKKRAREARVCGH
jgi:DNA-binding IscR family transcriptional regulator